MSGEEWLAWIDSTGRYPGHPLHQSNAAQSKPTTNSSAGGAREKYNLTNDEIFNYFSFLPIIYSDNLVGGTAIDPYLSVFHLVGDSSQPLLQSTIPLSSSPSNSSLAGALGPSSQISTYVNDTATRGPSQSAALNPASTSLITPESHRPYVPRPPVFAASNTYQTPVQTSHFSNYTQQPSKHLSTSQPTEVGLDRLLSSRFSIDGTAGPFAYQAASALERSQFQSPLGETLGQTTRLPQSHSRTEYAKSVHRQYDGHHGNPHSGQTVAHFQQSPSEMNQGLVDGSTQLVHPSAQDRHPYRSTPHAYSYTPSTHLPSSTTISQPQFQQFLTPYGPQIPASRGLPFNLHSPSGSNSGSPEFAGDYMGGAVMVAGGRSQWCPNTTTSGLSSRLLWEEAQSQNSPSRSDSSGFNSLSTPMATPSSPFDRSLEVSRLQCTHRHAPSEGLDKNRVLEMLASPSPSVQVSLPGDTSKDTESQALAVLGPQASTSTHSRPSLLSREATKDTLSPTRGRKRPSPCPDPRSGSDCEDGGRSNRRKLRKGPSEARFSPDEATPAFSPSGPVFGATIPHVNVVNIPCPHPNCAVTAVCDGPNPVISKPVENVGRRKNRVPKPYQCSYRNPLTGAKCHSTFRRRGCRDRHSSSHSGKESKDVAESRLSLGLARRLLWETCRLVEKSDWSCLYVRNETTDDENGTANLAKKVKAQIAAGLISSHQGATAVYLSMAEAKKRVEEEFDIPVLEHQGAVVKALLTKTPGSQPGNSNPNTHFIPDIDLSPYTMFKRLSLKRAATYERYFCPEKGCNIDFTRLDALIRHGRNCHNEKVKKERKQNAKLNRKKGKGRSNNNDDDSDDEDRGGQEESDDVGLDDG
ncbi:hypothetical protein FRC02_010467 [Tulasnella sp. 418]|nr:hypothetical protein FRC02_010467 [Tulasnella sp. 418]